MEKRVSDKLPAPPRLLAVCSGSPWQNPTLGNVVAANVGPPGSHKDSELIALDGTDHETKVSEAGGEMDTLVSARVASSLPKWRFWDVPKEGRLFLVWQDAFWKRNHTVGGGR